MGTHVVIDDQGQVQKALDHKMHLASRQAKATKDYSPLWEGVINLPEPSPDVTPVHQIQIVRQWCKAYEAMTGHKVLRADVHLDEGYIDATGHAQYNAHAHVMCDRTDDKGKVKKLTSTVLREVQSMTAEVTTLQRGLPAKQTQRRHVGHQHFRFDAEKNRLDLARVKAKADTEVDRVRKLGLKWSAEDKVKLDTSQAVAAKVPQLEAQISTQAAEIALLQEQYRFSRQALKASGEAKQSDYQALKKQHEAALADLAKAQAKLTTVQADLDGEPERLAAALAAQKAQLDEQYRLDRAALKASGEATQQGYQQLKKAHEAALAEAVKVPDLAKQLKASQQQAAQAQQGRDEAQSKAQQQAQEIAQLKAQYQRDREALKASGEATQQDYQQLKKQHEAALADLAKAQQVATQVPGLERQLKATQQEAINTKLTADERYKNLRGQALEIQAERNELAKKVLTLTQRAAAPQAQPERRPAPAAPAQTLAPRPAPQPVPRPTPALQAPAPAPAQTLAERLAESLQRLLDWIKGQGGVLKEINTEKDDCYGAVVQLDDLHAVQRVGRGTYAFHQLDKLDKVPTLDDPKTEISYRGGRGTVVGQGYGHGLGR